MDISIILTVVIVVTATVTVTVRFGCEPDAVAVKNNNRGLAFGLAHGPP